MEGGLFNDTTPVSRSLIELRKLWSTWIPLIEEAKTRILAQEKIMLSLVVLGVKQSKAQAWGKVLLENEGIKVIRKGKRFRVENI
jgi:hypothetical protein